VTGDEVYGDSPRLRETIQTHGRFYVLAVSANTRVWTERPEVQEPAEQTGGRPRRAPRVVQDAPKAQMVSEVVASLPSQAWKRLAVMEGEKGPIFYHWARTRVVESRDRLPGPQVPRRAQRDVDELIVLEAFENVSDLGFAGLKGESYGRKKNKTCRRWEQPRQDEAKKT